jgi:uncharacterized protein YbaR (Trm112 family)
MLVMTCPQCRRSLILDEATRGQLTSCPYCQTDFRAPLYDHEPAVAVESAAAGATSGDSLARAATIFAALGVLAVGGIIASKFLGHQLPVSHGALLGTLVLPVIPIGLSWYCTRRVSRPGFVYASRILGYVWLLGHLYLVTNGLR